MKVLVVDDNPEVRAGLARVLQRAGFDVVAAENGLAALAELEREQFAAVVCDIVMPVMDGIRLYEVIVQQYPAVVGKMLFMSASLGDPRVEAFLKATKCPVLAKPFDISEFVGQVRRLAGTAV